MMLAMIMRTVRTAGRTAGAGLRKAVSRENANTSNADGTKNAATMMLVRRISAGSRHTQILSVNMSP